MLCLFPVFAGRTVSHCRHTRSAQTLRRRQNYLTFYHASLLAPLAAESKAWYLTISPSVPVAPRGTGIGDCRSAVPLEPNGLSLIYIH